MAALSTIDRRFCVAPMLDCTDRHARFLLRLISKHSVLYTEMVTTGAILFGDQSRHLDFNQQEHPLALQLGGSNADEMAKCAVVAQQWGYDEVNINVGCPSDRVQSGAFGACLMKTPEVVAECVKSMAHEVDIPVTVKCRIGVDEQEPRDALWTLVESSANAGCSVFIVHARKAWLQGLSPKQNRDIRPIDYDLVYHLKRDFPELEIIINGGVNTLAESNEHLRHVDGVMMGREAYSNPFILSLVDQNLYNSDSPSSTRDEVLSAYIDYAKTQIESGVRLNHMSRHAVGLFHGEPRSRLWRRHISQNAHLPESDHRVLNDAYHAMITG